MDPDRYRRAEQIFQECIALPPEARSEHIDSATDGDDDLAAWVRRMVSYDDRALVTMQFRPATPASSETSQTNDGLAGQQIGPYRILRLVGEGGFGAVYEAHQEHPVRRTVALKILKSGLGSSRVIDRFAIEQQALAVMDHPGIARVFDAGQTDVIHGSRPFFVMEFVVGEPITEYCARKQLNLSSRLELFITVCQAVQHAHHKGIIHRDLKPSNILVCEVDGVAMPKIIDFGIAKALHQPLTEAMLVTNRMELLGTPQYMSPEQADADEHAIDTRTDVYSLGVVLYELLTGSTPLEPTSLQSASYTRMLQMILEQQIERPSMRVARLSNGEGDSAWSWCTNGTVLARRLHGELDWIALKALETERERRYYSAALLGEDLRRYLRHEPVLAGPPNAAYRMRKFVRRHRVGVAATGLVALALVGGAIGTTVGMVRARDSAEKARDAADQAMQINNYLTDMLLSVDPDRGKGADVRFVEVLGNASITAGQRFANYPALEAQVREVLGQVYSRLSMFPESRLEFQRAVVTYESVLGPEHPGTLECKVHYAQSLGNGGRISEVSAALDGLAERIERVLGRHHDLWFEAQNLNGIQLAKRKKRDESVAFLQQLSQEAAAAGANEVIQLNIKRGIAQSMWLQLENTHGPARKPMAIQVEAISRDVVDRSTRLLGPTSTMALQDQIRLALASSELAKYEEASEACQAVLDASMERFGECHTIRTQAMDVLIKARLRQGKADQAADLELKNIECARLGAPILLIAALSDALVIFDRGDRWADGEKAARELVTRLAEIGGGHGQVVLDSELSFARFVSLQGRIDEAEQMFQPLLAREPEAKDDLHVIARMHYCYGAHLVQRGLYEQAEGHLQLAANALGDVRQGTWNIVPDDLIIEFIGLYRAWGKPEKVAEYQLLQQEALSQYGADPIDGQ